jgi:hypothetical protein
MAPMNEACPLVPVGAEPGRALISTGRQKPGGFWVQSSSALSSPCEIPKLSSLGLSAKGGLRPLLGSQKLLGCGLEGIQAFE